MWHQIAYSKEDVQIHKKEVAGYVEQLVSAAWDFQNMTRESWQVEEELQEEQ